MRTAHAEERSSAVAVLQRIIGNVQVIIRSELQLLKVELLEDAGNVAKASGLIAIGAALAQLAAGCLLLSAIYLLSTLLPPWLAALVVALICGAVALMFVIAGRQRLAQLDGEKDKPFGAIEFDTAKEEGKWVTAAGN